MRTFCLLICAFCIAVCAEDVKIEKLYTGVVEVTLDITTDEEKVPGPMVIRNQETFDSFVEMIPKNAISKTNPPPPSQDPLLKEPQIDFSRHMILVMFRSGTTHVAPNVEKVTLDMESEVMTVEYSHPPLGKSAMAARPYAIGAYCAAVIEKFSGKVVFTKVEHDAATEEQQTEK